MAERGGFEPPRGYNPLLVFKTSAFNRSATSPFARAFSAFDSTGARQVPKTSMAPRLGRRRLYSHANKWRLTIKQ